MAAAPITAFEADRIVDAAKSINTPLLWTAGANEVWAKASVPVANGLGVKLTIAATASLVLPERFSLSLLANNIRIRGLCANKAHGNKHEDDLTFSPGTHLHVWTDRCRDRVASPVDGISDKLDEAIAQFCDLCSIDLNASIAPLPAYQADFRV